MFSLINEISEKEAQTIIDFYHRIYPGINQYYEAVRNRLSTRQRTLENLFGRKYRFLEKWGPDLFKSAYSFNPQSTVGELVNRAMDRIYDDNSDETSELEILMQTHDDIKFQDQYQDLDKLVKCIRKIRDYMDVPLVANGREFTIGTDMKIGFNFGKMKEINIDVSDEELKLSIQGFIDEQKQQATTV
jgi:DNA polymerase I-like protein with 3'-5' exonuclease and polymerase domains